MSIRIEDLLDREKFKEEMIQLRRVFHQFPELSQHESQTAERICKFLDNIGVPYKKHIADNGIMAWISGETGTVVAVRGDMDALPIEERNDVPYCSKVPGKMHACGHDVHITVLLGLAKLLSLYKDKLKGTVKLFFQPAEETVGGAAGMIKEGVLENPRVDVVLGLHVEPSYDIGQVGIKFGKMYAASDMVDVRIYGKSAHGAHPDEGVDVICIAAEIVTAIQIMIAREVNPLDSAVCTFGSIHGGTVRNQIADSLEMQGIIRTVDPDTRIRMRKRVKEICCLTAKKMGADAEVMFYESYGSLINDDCITQIVKNSAEELLGKEKVIIEETPDLSCEDFSCFAEQRPACYFHLGCYSEKAGERVDLHNSMFDIDEECIINGIELQFNNIINIEEEYTYDRR